MEISNRQVDTYKSAVKRSEVRYTLMGIITIYLKPCGIHDTT